MTPSSERGNPLPPDINAMDATSFAAYTLRHRLPHILQGITRSPLNAAGCDEGCVGRLEAIATELATGTIIPLPRTAAEDEDAWAACVEPHLGKRWVEAPFLFVEFYFYRRIMLAMAGGEAWVDQGAARIAPASIDPFSQQKQHSLDQAAEQALRLGQWLASAEAKPSPSNVDNRVTHLSATFNDLLMANLWSNCADLSQLPETFRPQHSAADTLSAETPDSPGKSPSPTDRLLIDQGAVVVHYVVQREASLERVDIILDNTGIELISDLALADFLLTRSLAHQVVLHGKSYPVFVSDATRRDIEQVLMLWQNHDDAAMQQWGQRLQEAIAQGRLLIQDHYFWTLPLCFDAMPPDLAAEMASSDLWISKGDANYRRLVGDRPWPLSTPLEAVTRYLPTPCLALRVLKCEVLVGLEIEEGNTGYAQVNQRAGLDPDWMTNGTYGIIQFADCGHN